MTAISATVAALAAGATVALAAPAYAGPAGIVIQTSDATVYEGASGQSYASFEVRRIGKFTGKAQTVQYRTADGDATAGSDYGATTGSLVFDSKHALYTVNVPVYGDADQEQDEYFLLLVTPSGGGDGEGRGVILNDDGWT